MLWFVEPGVAIAFNGELPRGEKQYKHSGRNMGLASVMSHNLFLTT